MTGQRRHASRALTAALLLAVPAAALAQGRARAPAPKPAAAAPKAAPAPAPAAEPVPAAPPLVERGPWRIAVALGREQESETELAGVRLGLELEKDLLALGRRGQLAFVLPAAWFHGTSSDSVTGGGQTLTTDVTMELLELVPSFRASFAPVTRLRLFAEVGVGGAWATTKTVVETSLAGVPATESTGDAFSGVLRFVAGGTFQLNDRVRLGVELPSIQRRYGEGVAQTLSFSARAAYAF